VELETQLADVKAELKSRKEEARLMIEEMEKIGRDLATRKTIPTQIERKKMYTTSYFQLTALHVLLNRL
jgi:hypothetical protein